MRHTAHIRSLLATVSQGQALAGRQHSGGGGGRSPQLSLAL